jgi:hypothetical protein
VSRLQELIRQHEALGEEMRATERFQAAQRKIGKLRADAVSPALRGVSA